MEEAYQELSANEIVSNAYVELAQYTAKTRNYPNIKDGMKMAYRRLLYSAKDVNKMTKAAKIVGSMLGIHPHGDESAYSVLVECTCRYNSFPLFTGKGNWGGLGECLDENTMVSLLDGRELSMKEIHKEVMLGKELYVYACTKDGHVVPRRITNSFDNGTRNTIKITLDNNETIICTPDHEFMMRDGSFKQAKDLQEYDSLMPLYRSYSGWGYELVKDNCTQSMNFTHRLEEYKIEDYDKTHLLNEKLVVHHKDYNKHNNNPNNLVWMTWDEHTKLHSEVCCKQLHTPEVQAKAAEGIRRMFSNMTDEEKYKWVESRGLFTDEVKNKAKLNRKKSVDLMSADERKAKFKFPENANKIFWKSLSDEEKSEFLLRTILDPEIQLKAYNNGINRSDVRDTAYNNGIGSMTYEERCNRAKIGSRTNISNNPNYYSEMSAKGGWKKALQNDPYCSIKGRILGTYQVYIRMFGKDSDITEENWKLACKEYGRGRGTSYETMIKYYDNPDNMISHYYDKYNHKVVSIEFINEDHHVYDIEVEELHNFALSSGIFVHNCAAAMRYPEAVLNDIARLMYLELIDYAEYVDGEVDNKEPEALPALIPYAFLSGSSGFSVGMPGPDIPPMNAMDLVNYYINLLEGKEVSYPAPDYGSVILNCEKDEHSDKVMKDGEGLLWFEPFIIQEDYNKLVINQSTPYADIWKKINYKKLAEYINDNTVDFIDETDENGYRYVYVINNLNKLTLDQLREILTNGLKCSHSYRFLFENNGRVYNCNFDFVVKHQMKYLRECVIRKYKDYLNKSKKKSLVLEAINKLRENEEVVSQMYKMNVDDLKKIIMNWGYEESVVSSVVSKPISYLTRSHDEELNTELDNQEIYQSYINDPDIYLLTLYYRLKDLITPFYESRTHSVFKNDLSTIDKNRCQISSDHKLIEFGNDKSINWNSIIYGMTKYGKIQSFVVPKITVSPVGLINTDNDEFIGISGDNIKYIIFIYDGNYISVIPKSKITSGINTYVKVWSEEYPANCAFGYSEESIHLIDVRGNEFDINCSNYVRARISQPQKVNRYKLQYYINEDGDKIEISNGIS